MVKNRTKKRFIYLGIFLVCLVIEILIGMFVHDQIVRPYVGDVLVIILLCCFARIFFPEKPRLLGVYMTLVGVVAELLQLAQLSTLLGVNGTPLEIILGSTFDWKDIVCYLVGGALFILFEQVVFKLFKSKNNN